MKLRLYYSLFKRRRTSNYSRYSVITRWYTIYGSTVWSKGQPWSKIDTKLKVKICQTFTVKKLNDLLIDKYRIKYCSSSKFHDHTEDITTTYPGLIFPWYTLTNNIQFLKIEPISSNKAESLISLEATPLEPNCVFGWNVVDEDSKQLIITDNEFDAVAANQSTGLPTVAMTTSAIHDHSLPAEIMEQLEKFDKIYLWTRKDYGTAPLIFESLSKPDCHLVRCKDNRRQFNGPLDALNKGYNLKDIISKSELVTKDDKILISVHQLKDKIYSEFLNHETVAGVKWKRFPGLAKCLKGFRAGEMTVFIGPTGGGKTTLVSELSLDICQQEVPTLWGSFEISNVRLGKMLFRQFSGLNFEENLSNFQYWMDKFQNLPFRFMNFHGQTDIDEVINTMARSITKYGIQHVIIDNLQFMIGSSSCHRGFDDSLYAQNRAIAKFRYFATYHNVHVTIVIHPRKENEEKLLTTSSIYGTAKAGQEADNVLILQVQSPKDKFLQVTKNRFSGDLGKIPLRFDHNSLTYSGIFFDTDITTNVAKTKKHSKSHKTVSTLVRPLSHNNNFTNGVLKPPLLIKPLRKLN